MEETLIGYKAYLDGIRKEIKCLVIPLDFFVGIFK